MSSISAPNFSAMNPSTEKTTNPAMKLVQLFSTHSQMLSLQDKTNYMSLVIIQDIQDIVIITFCWVLTYSCWFCKYCNFQEQLCYQLLNCRRRKSESLHLSKPIWHSNEAKFRFFANVTNLDFIIQNVSCLNSGHIILTVMTPLPVSLRGEKVLDTGNTLYQSVHQATLDLLTSAREASHKERLL